VGMGLMILGLSYFIGNQRQTITLYKENDLKYRYIKMQGQNDEESLYQLEQQFKYNDCVKIVRKQVERYEKLIREHIEKLYRVKYNSEEIEMLQKQIKMTKSQKIKR
jgi:1-deoxy-D-xylulose 5-phosphate reductoisomerase